MKMMGLIGGMTWLSTAEYYRVINELVRRRLGGSHSARCLVSSFDFHEIESLQNNEDWQAAAERLSAAGRALERAGAEFLIICTNTMHKVADEIQRPPVDRTNPPGRSPLAPPQPNPDSSPQ